MVRYGVSSGWMDRPKILLLTRLGSVVQRMQSGVGRIKPGGGQSSSRSGYHGARASRKDSWSSSWRRLFSQSQVEGACVSLVASASAEPQSSLEYINWPLQRPLFLFLHAHVSSPFASGCLSLVSLSLSFSFLCSNCLRSLHHHALTHSALLMRSGGCPERHFQHHYSSPA